jgi:hypothetical protein
MGARRRSGGALVEPLRKRRFVRAPAGSPAADAQVVRQPPRDLLWLFKLLHMSISNVPFESRVPCPCCGFPTLSEVAAYEICELCNWEDDGQGNVDADIVRGGPNGDYSLTDARANFRRYLVMYRPDNDTRATGADSPVEVAAKRDLITAFERLQHVTDDSERANIVARARDLEALLEAEMYRGLREYEDRHRAGGSA